MRASVKVIISFVFVLAVLFTMQTFAAQQEDNSRQLFAQGKGTINVGQEEFDVHAVTIKLLGDGKAEITLTSDITFFLQGTWSENEKARNQIDLKITGTMTSGGVEGNGKVVLRDDGKSIASMTLEGTSRTRKTKVNVRFVGQ